MATQWTKIKAEYLAGGISQKKLAEKHGVPYSTLRDRAQAEGWTKLRAKTRQKTGEKLTESVSDTKIKKIEELVDKLIAQSLKAARQNTERPVITRERRVDPEAGTETVTVRTTFERTKNVDKQGLRLIAQTAKDLYTIVAQLRQDGEGDKNAVTVRFESGEEYGE